MRAFLTATSLFALSSLALLPRAAHAESTCSADSDCVKGWTCQVTGGSGCAAPACPPNEKCDPQPVDCVTEEFKSCRPAPCSADSDCADGLVCYTHTESNCAPIACAPGQTCPQPVCEAKTESACLPRYMLPCTTANDCGSGFRCEAAEICSCSGGGSAPSSGSGSSGSAGSGATPTPTPEPEPDCSCEPSAQKSCSATPTPCTADSDCASGWTCATFTSKSDCTNPATPEPNSGASGGAASGAPAPDCAAPVEVKQCMPPYYALIDGVRGVGHGASDGPSVGGSAQEPSGGVIPPLAAGDDKGSNNASDGESASSTSSAGCSVTHGVGNASFTLALFGVLGVFSALRRRRAR